MTVTLTLPPDAERVLRERAARRGVTVEGYIEELVNRDAGMVREFSPPSPDEVRRLLKLLAANSDHLPVLPGRLDRAELYADHD
jgi:hypothetical protein